MRKKNILVKVPVLEFSESTRTLIALIYRTVQKRSRKEQKAFWREFNNKFGERFMKLFGDYVEDVAGQLSEQGLFDEWGVNDNA